MKLPSDLLQAAPLAYGVDCTQSPLQAGLHRSPWHVTVASMLLCRAKRDAALTAAMFTMWPTPEAMSFSDVALEELLRPLGLHRQRARYIQQLSRKWTTYWVDLRAHPGVGQYVAAAVELFCFNCTEHAACDHVLSRYAETLSGPTMGEVDGRWFVDGDEFTSPLEAYYEYADRLASQA